MKAQRTQAFLTKIAVFGIGMLVLGSTTTWAADMCFRDTSGATLVAKNNFSFPAAGTCKPVNGVGVGGGCVITGTACGTSDNGFIRFHLNYSCTEVFAVGTRTFRIGRVNSGLDQAGFGYSCQADGFDGATSSCEQMHVKTIPCGTSSVPVH